MAKIYHKEFKKKLDDKNKIIWTNEPKHENKFKTNLKEKRISNSKLLINFSPLSTVIWRYFLKYYQ